MSGAVSAVTYVEVEAALLRIERGEADARDANLLRVIIRGLEGRMREYEKLFAEPGGEVAETEVQPTQPL